jgi:hypothetical protein
MSEALQQIDPSRAFERYVEADPLVCNSCFVKHSRDILDENSTHQVESKGEIGERATTADDDEGRVVGTEPIREHSARYNWYSVDMCPECGSASLTSPSDTLSIKEASRRAVRLSNRLYERGLDHNWRLLVWFVRRCKRNEDLAGKDQEIVARAVEFVLEPR